MHRALKVYILLFIYYEYLYTIFFILKIKILKILNMMMIDDGAEKKATAGTHARPFHIP